VRRYCQACGGPVRGGASCGRCGARAPGGPKVLVACFVFHEARLLWMRRAQEPQRGRWAVPAGFMEVGESLAEAAARELREETNLALDPAALALYSLGSITALDQVYVAFRASVGAVDCAPGPEALEVRFFSARELPWEEIAFPSANYAISKAYEEASRGRFGLHLARHELCELIAQLAVSS